MADYLDADEAATFLGVRKETLYAYVSRGQLESVASERDARKKQYRRRDLERLQRRKRAATGEGPPAAEALNWGSPSLETEISELTALGPRYRGVRIGEWLDEGRSFESIAEWLWRGEMPDESPRWRVTDRQYESAGSGSRRVNVHPLEEIVSAVQEARLQDPRTYAPNEAAFDSARQLVKGSVLQAGLRRRGDDALPDTEDWSVARCACWALGRDATDSVVGLIDRLMVVVAEHGLNASTFAGRVAASTGADLYACVLAALSAFSGPRHGLHSESVRAFLSSIEAVGAVEERVRDQLRRGRDLPGFGHPIYEHGDPRFSMVRSALDEIEGAAETRELVDAVCDAADRAGLPPPNVDVGVSAVAEALELANGGGPFLFAIGRTAGWIAHVLEQREADVLLRPRSTYVGEAREE